MASPTRHRALTLGLLGIVLAGCPRSIPPHLARAGSDAPPPDAEDVIVLPTTLDEALVGLVDGDPLVRSPALPRAEALDAVLPDDGVSGDLVAVLTALETLEVDRDDPVEAVPPMEPTWRGTVGTVVLRGYRLQLADRLLATHPGQPDAPALDALGPLLTPLRRGDTEPQGGRGLMAFLARDLPFAEAVQRYGDRWALAAWFDHPELPRDAAAEALERPVHGRLATTSLGELLAASVREAPLPEGDVSGGLADLRLATELSLQRAAADRDSEQGAYSDRRLDLAESLGVSDPIAHLLERARQRLTAAAPDPVAVGGALIAIQALRWTGDCGEAPCTGVDRIDTLDRARAWSDELVPLVRAWRALALKDAMDAMDVGHDTVLFPRALIDLVDALTGTGAATLSVNVLSRTSPDAFVWRELATSVGNDEATTWEDARIALGSHLSRESFSAAEVNEEPMFSWLDAIRRRAIP